MFELISMKQTYITDLIASFVAVEMCWRYKEARLEIVSAAKASRPALFASGKLQWKLVCIFGPYKMSIAAKVQACKLVHWVTFHVFRMTQPG
jgi:hypothetical protein